MKMSEVFLRAAEINFKDGGPTCMTVEEIGGLAPREFYNNLMRPPRATLLAWAWHWSTAQNQYTSTDEDVALVHECRVIALCLAAAIAADEERRAP